MAGCRVAVMSTDLLLPVGISWASLVAVLLFVYGVGYREVLLVGGGVKDQPRGSGL